MIEAGNLREHLIVFFIGALIFGVGVGIAVIGGGIMWRAL